MRLSICYLNNSYSHFHGQCLFHSVLLEVWLQFEGGHCSRAAFTHGNLVLKVWDLNESKLGLIDTHIAADLEHNTSLEELILSRNSQLAEGDSEAVGCALVLF